MSFLKTTRKHWCPSDFSYSDVKVCDISASILHITKAITLLESRADQYSAYLRSVFHAKENKWIEAIDRWNFEERQHGVALQLLCEATDDSFSFSEKMASYTGGVRYHETTGESVRGSVAGELVARCVVEALASTFYRVLNDAVSDKTYKLVFQTLSKDEARHFGMFNSMLEFDAKENGELSVFNKLKIAIQRMLELEDEQIIFASHVVFNREKTLFDRTMEANLYIRSLHHLYKLKHVSFASTLLCKTIFGTTAKSFQITLTWILWFAIKIRWVLSVIYLTLPGFATSFRSRKSEGLQI